MLNTTDNFGSEIHQSSKAFMLESIRSSYSYNFTSLGRPIIQYPQDIVAMQELIWAVQPDLIIETGIAHGGSLILNASMLAILDYCDAATHGTALNPKASRRKVLGIDIDIRQHNLAAIESHPMSHMIHMIQGSSISKDIVEQVHSFAKPYKKIMVCLDSNHTHDHVLEELRAYAPLTSTGSYCVVFDTVVEDLPSGMYPDRPWDVGNNPKTAVFSYLEELSRSTVLAQDQARLILEIDKAIDKKLLISVAPDGYLKRT
jgi:cephalosporin hydroxylase